MNRSFPKVRWVLLAALNFQCLYFYVFAFIPRVRLEAHPTAGPHSRLLWWSGVAFSLALSAFRGVTIDRFGRSVLRLITVYTALIAAISQWARPLGVARTAWLLMVISVPIQMISVFVLVRRLRGGQRGSG